MARRTRLQASIQGTHVFSATLPDRWHRVRIGDVADVNPGLEYPAELPENALVTFVPMAAASEHSHIITRPELRPLSEVWRGYTHFTDGDVLFAKITPSMENGKAAIAEALSNGVGCGSTEFHVLRPRARVLAKWLYHYVHQQAFRTSAAAQMKGTAGQLRVPGTYLEEATIPIPPLPEQHRIVDAIEAQFSRLDAAVAALKRAQANLARYKASVLQAACEGRLVPTEAELARHEGRDYEPADVLLQRILAERRRTWEQTKWAELVEGAKKKTAQARRKAAGLPSNLRDLKDEEWQDLPEEAYAAYLPKNDRWKAQYQEPAPPDTAGLPGLPEGWVWTRLGQAFEVYVGATPRRSIPEYWGGTVPWVSSGEVAFCRISQTTETITELGMANCSTDLHPPGTVLLGMIGEGRTRGQAAILDVAAAHNQNSAAIRVSETGQPPEYLYYYLAQQYEQTRTLGSGNNQPALNKRLVQAIPMPLPPLAEQRRILTQLESVTSVIDCLLITVELSLKRANRLRQSILKRAFEGRLVPQDPAEAPAAAAGADEPEGAQERLPGL